MKDKKTRKGSGKRAALTVLCVILAVVLVVLLGATAFVNHLYSQMNYVDPDTQETISPEEMETLDEVDPDATGPTIDESDIDWGNQDHNTQIGGEDSNIINILLIGQDRREGWGRSRSDTMILCSFNKETKTLTMTSFLRDLYVQIPGYTDNKLNSTYPAGGMQLLNDTLEENFGIHVDGNIEVDFAGFADIVELLGGVEMELRQDEANFINRNLGYSGLNAGMQLLNGEQALMYARIRSLDLDADFSRTNRQRKVISALIEKVRDSSMSTLLSLLDEVLPMVTTDMKQSEIISLATELYPMLTDMQIVSQRIPADGTYTCPTIRGMSVVLADMDAARKLLEETLGG